MCHLISAQYRYKKLVYYLLTISVYSADLIIVSQNGIIFYPFSSKPFNLTMKPKPLKNGLDRYAISRLGRDKHLPYDGTKTNKV